MNKKKPPILYRIASRPLFSAVASVVAILAGALASFFTDSIRMSLGLPPSPTSGDGFAYSNFHVTLEAKVFWSLVLLAIVMFALSKAADARGARSNHSEIADMLNRAQSLPSDDFLKHYQEIFEGATKYASIPILNDDAAIRDVESAIRVLLGAIVKLALVYDEVDEAETTYSANVMVLEKKWELDALAVVCDVDHLVEASHIGVLSTFSELSTSSTALDEPDASLPNFSLPVHKKEEGRRGRTNILPGAPEAYAGHTFCRYDSREILFVALDEKMADHNQAEAIKRYFTSGGGEAIRSFVCIPIPAVSMVGADAAGRACLGVLNVHANRVGLLAYAGERFVPIVMPLVYQVSLLLGLWQAARAQEVRES